MRLPWMLDPVRIARRGRKLVGLVSGQIESLARDRPHPLSIGTPSVSCCLSSCLSYLAVALSTISWCSHFGGGLE
eukprot:3261320-Pyramimonas_sp.AAC.1